MIFNFALRAYTDVMPIIIYVVIAFLVIGSGGMFWFSQSEPPSVVDDLSTTEEDGGLSDTPPITPEPEGANPAERQNQTGSTVDLSGQQLNSVPSTLFNQRDTVTLNLSQNNLQGALAAEVRQLSNLRELDLSYNNFTGVPAEVGQLTKLEVLNLSHNPLTGLPYEIGNLQNLRVLDLRGTNYAPQDLEIIRSRLPGEVEIFTD